MAEVTRYRRMHSERFSFIFILFIIPIGGCVQSCSVYCQLVGGCVQSCSEYRRSEVLGENSQKPGTAESAIVSAGLNAPIYWNDTR
jgi:hypothetical protein